MKLKIFGDTTPINWSGMGIKMPFAPMHELAEKYELEKEPYYVRLPLDDTLYISDLRRTFEVKELGDNLGQWGRLEQRIALRVRNTIAAQDQCTPDTICINLGAGYHHAGKKPNTGYAYSLINDIIWAVDYQLEQNKTIGIIDLDFHFGGGTYEYYYRNPKVQLYDSYHPRGILQKHVYLTESDHHPVWSSISDNVSYQPDMNHSMWADCDKILLNIGTDWYKNDTLFGQYGCMEAEDLLNVWKATITQIINRNTPLAITMGGGYGPHGLKLYESLIQWLQQL